MISESRNSKIIYYQVPFQNITEFELRKKTRDSLYIIVNIKHSEQHITIYNFSLLSVVLSTVQILKLVID